MQKTDSGGGSGSPSHPSLSQPPAAPTTRVPHPDPTGEPVGTRNTVQTDDQAQDGEVSGNGSTARPGSGEPSSARSPEPEPNSVWPGIRSAIYRLQTRLGLLVGFAENVQAAHDRMSPEVLEQQLGLIVENGRHISEMVDELLAVVEEEEKS